MKKPGRIVLIFLILIGSLSMPTTALSSSACQACEYQGGATGTCVDAGTAPHTLSECEGIERCWRWAGGGECFPDCAGYDCYWT